MGCGSFPPTAGPPFGTFMPSPMPHFPLHVPLLEWHRAGSAVNVGQTAPLLCLRSSLVPPHCCFKPGFSLYSSERGEELQHFFFLWKAVKPTTEGNQVHSLGRLLSQQHREKTCSPSPLEGRVEPTLVLHLRWKGESNPRLLRRARQKERARTL